VVDVPEKHGSQPGVRMIDVGEKAITRRTAVARGRLKVTPAQCAALAAGDLAKGEWRTTAQLAGIQGAKKCPEWIPLCHPIAIDQTEVKLELDEAANHVQVEATVRASARTGVEMEALCAVSAALLSVYDMIKSIDKAAYVETIHVVEKSGGKSGTWRRSNE